MNWRRTPLLSLLLECLSNYWYISSHLRNHWCENWILDIGKIWSSDTSFFRKYSNIETTWSTLLKIMKMVYSKQIDELFLSSNFCWYIDKSIILSSFKTFGASQISRQLLKWCLTFKYIYEQLNWRHEAWSRSLKIMQSGYIKWFDGLLSCLLEHWSYYYFISNIFGESYIPDDNCNLLKCSTAIDTG